MGLTCAETLFGNRVKAKLGWTATLGRSANLTRPINGRQPCHYCGPCERGCVTHLYFNAAFTTVADALKTGNCTLIPNAMVYKVLMDKGSHRATGVLYVDRVTRQPREVMGRAVIVSAQALESVRILLNSATEQDPGGSRTPAGPSATTSWTTSGWRGGASGEFPEVAEKPAVDGPHRPDGIYVIRFRNTKDKKYDRFLRGYGFQGRGGSGSTGTLRFRRGVQEGGRRSRDLGRARGFGECLPRYENFVEIDTNVVDAFGIPVLKIQLTWSDRQNDPPPKRANRSLATRGVNFQVQASFSTSCLMESTGSKTASILRRAAWG
jgi:choline dehydrogenase-like flavoprotein